MNEFVIRHSLFDIHHSSPFPLPPSPSRLWASEKKGPAGDPVAYVFGTVRTVARQHRSQEARAARRPLWMPERPDGDPSLAAANAEGRALVRAALKSLPIAQQDAVVLHLYGGLTFRQIARTLGEPLKTIATRYRRALLRIKEMLDGLA